MFQPAFLWCHGSLGGLNTPAQGTMRQQRPRGTTTRESVVSAALDIVDQVGVDGLTIRAIASAVGAPPMSLYTHFANKEELLDLMYAEMAHRLYADSGKQTWQTELLALTHHMRQTLLAHPRWTPLLSRPAPPMAMTVRERILKLMVESGMSSADGLTALSSAIVAGMGLVLVELTFREPDGASSFARRFERIRDLFEEEAVPSEPISREAFTRVRHFDFDEIFRFTIQRLIEGVTGPHASTKPG
jgi:TetR/AcrR family transcriptional regulator, tetracycline repressor protein